MNWYRIATAAALPIRHRRASRSTSDFVKIATYGMVAMAQAMTEGL